MAISQPIQETKKGDLPLEVQDEISLAKTQLNETFESQRTAILRIGTALQKVFAEKPEKICAHIKFVLKDLIDEEKISAKTIERVCPEEWKNPIKAAAGREGADKVSAKRKIKMRTGGGSELEGTSPEVGELKVKYESAQSQVSTLQLTIDNFVPIISKAKEIECDCATCQMAREIRI